MNEVNLYSFLSVFAFQMLGATAHWLKMKRTKRIRGNIFGYYFGDQKGKSTATFIMLVGSAWFSCTSGIGDLLNPSLLWSYLEKGSLHITSVNAVLAAITTGYAFDSMSNKSAA
jgi:hypothetical protein